VIGVLLAGLCAVLLVAVLRLQRRLELVARAEHELRAPATAFLLAVERMRRDPAARRHAAAIEPELERLQVALADLSAARRGRRAAPLPRRLDAERFTRSALAAWRTALERSGRATVVRWHAPRSAVKADPRRMAQALGNVLANAAEHGAGPTEVEARPAPGGLAIEVTTRVPSVIGRSAGGRRPGQDRGRGLSIAAAAARDVGGRMTVERENGRFTARLELPSAAESPAEEGPSPDGPDPGERAAA